MAIQAGHEVFRYGFPIVPRLTSIELRYLYRRFRQRGMLLSIVFCLLVSVRLGLAQPSGIGVADADADIGFGPQISIERIEITGNTSTSDAVIRAVLPIDVGDVMRVGSHLLRETRYQILALGFFRDVKLSLAKGTRRGQIIVMIEVVERGTIALNRLYFGSANISPWWAGIDLSERNFLGTGVRVGGAVVGAGEGNAEGSSSQQSVELRVSHSALFGTRLGWEAAAFALNASEPYRIDGAASDSSIENFRAFDYRRIGGRAGVNLRISSHSFLSVGGRVEQVKSEFSGVEIQRLPNGGSKDVDSFLKPGKSRVVVVVGGFDRDKRSDPVLTSHGTRFQIQGQASGFVLGSEYDYLSMLAKYQQWWPLEESSSHVVSMHLSAGAVVGDVPLFDRLHVGDFNRMVSARSLGLVTSTTSSLDILGTSTDEIRYGEIGGLAEVQYSYKLFRKKNTIYGGEFFIGTGLWSLLSTDDLLPRDSLPIDLLVDMGIRLDTEIGIFELSFANALGRLPL